jgi:hypothetical protein
MRFWRKSKSRVTGINIGIPPFSVGASWEKDADEREVRARGERADAFSELWGIAQDAHLGLRNDFDRVDELADVHQQLNILLIRKAPALEPADVELAKEFIGALGEFIRRLRPLSGEAAARMRDEVAMTGPVHVPLDLAELDACYQRVIALNQSLAQRYRAVVFGESTQ